MSQPTSKREMFSEFRADGWPLCPACGEDELYSTGIPATIETIRGCLLCEWSPAKFYNAKAEVTPRPAVRVGNSADGVNVPAEPPAREPQVQAKKNPWTKTFNFLHYEAWEDGYAAGVASLRAQAETARDMEIEKIHNEFLSRPIEFCEADGTIRKIVYEKGDHSVGINDAWVAEEEHPAESVLAQAQQERQSFVIEAAAKSADLKIVTTKLSQTEAALRIAADEAAYDQARAGDDFSPTAMTKNAKIIYDEWLTQAAAQESAAKKRGKA